MSLTATSTHAPDALHTLRESYSLHLDATRSAKTALLYLAALDSLIRHLGGERDADHGAGGPTGAC